MFITIISVVNIHLSLQLASDEKSVQSLNTEENEDLSGKKHFANQADV